MLLVYITIVSLVSGSLCSFTLTLSRCPWGFPLFPLQEHRPGVEDNIEEFPLFIYFEMNYFFSTETVYSKYSLWLLFIIIQPHHAFIF